MKSRKGRTQSGKIKKGYKLTKNGVRPTKKTNKKKKQ